MSVLGPPWLGAWSHRAGEGAHPVPPRADLNGLHIAFSVADVYNAAGLGIVTYPAAKAMERTVSKEEVLPGRSVG